jgi:ribosomal protein S18 acetylase RimI-like enzyme
MTINVEFTDQPTGVLADAGPFLESEPVLHNVILSLLQERLAHPQPGRYWIATEDATAAGVLFQSPPTFAATITPMRPGVVTALVGAIATADVALPGVIGDAATAARFAGEWTERRKSAAYPYEGQRIYELGQLREGASVDGHLRVATIADRELILAWFAGFEADVGDADADTGRNVEARLHSGQYWLWEDREPVSMSWASPPVAGVSRIGAVYTPPERRNRGYAETCVRELSRALGQQNIRCMLYTQLDNATSNAIYHRIGYRAIAEALRYRFD